MSEENESELDRFRAAVSQQRTPLPRDNEGARIVVKRDEVEWYTPPKGTNPSRLGPVLGLPIKTFEIFLQQIPAGASSDMHQHHHEAVHCVLQGTGYSEVDGTRYDWSTGDFISIPPMMWHRHYNSSLTEPVEMLLVENSRLLESLGLNYRSSAGLVTAEELNQTHKNT